MPINSKRIAKNTMVLYFRMILLMIISLYTSRVVLNVLGVQDYGIYNVVGGVVAFLGFLNATLTTASARFITVSLTDKYDSKQRRVIFTSVFAVNLILAVVVILLSETIGLWFLYNKMRIPAERFDAAFWVYQMSVLTVAVSIIGIVYNASVVAHERMNVFAYLALFDGAAKLIMVLLIQHTSYDKLVVYAFAMMMIQIADRLCYYGYCKLRFKEDTRLMIVYDKPLIKKILGFIGWSSYGSFATAGFTQGLNILLNLFFNPAVNAARGIAVQIQNTVFNFTNNLQMALNPQIIKTTAAEDFENARKLLVANSKFAFYLLCILGMPIISETHFILNVWLGKVPQYSVDFCRIMLIISMWSCLASPLRTINQAEGNIRRFQLYECTLLLFIVPISYFVLKIWQVPILVFVVHFVIEILAQFVRLWIVLPKIKMKFTDYLSSVYLRIIPVFILPLAFILFVHETMPENLARVAISFIGCELVMFVLMYCVGMTKDEKRFIFSVIKNRIRRKS